MFVSSAPGKVIIFGEHSAVYYKPALAASASSLRTYLLVEECNEGCVELDFPDIEFSYKWTHEQLKSVIAAHRDDNALSEHQLRSLEPLIQSITNDLHRSAAVCFLYLFTSILEEGFPSVRFIMKSTLPVGAGLGSSASISVSLAQAMLRLSGKRTNREIINQWAYVGEMCIHGDPSGIDNAIATYGGAIQFTKGLPLQPLETPHPMKMILTYTRIPRSTKTLVAGVRALYEEEPTIIAPIIDSMAQLAIRGAKAIQEDDLDMVLKLVRINHGHLVSLGVSHPGLEQIRVLCDQLNIGQTKLTGAGGGGCAFTILRKDVPLTAVADFKKLLEQEHGYKTYDTQLGGVGCTLLELNQTTEQQQSDIRELFTNHSTATAAHIDALLLPTNPNPLPWTS